MPPAIRIDGLIAAKRPAILQSFTREVLMRGFPTPQATAAEIARPADACITALIRSLGPAPLDDHQKLALAVDYAEQRARLGYDLRALLTEFGLLRGILLEAIGAQVASTDAGQRIADFLHEVMVEAALRFASPARHRISAAPASYS